MRIKDRIRRFFRRRKKQKLQVIYDNAYWKDKLYLLDLIFIYNDKTKRDVKELLRTDTNLTKKEIKKIVKAGSQVMQEVADRDRQVHQKLEESRRKTWN